MPQHPVTRNRINSGLRMRRFRLLLARRVFVRASLWSVLSRDARHPVATHLRRQLDRGRRLPVLQTSLAYGFILLIVVAYLYNAIDHAIVWLLPFLLMLFSTFYCAIWIARIVPVMSQQSVLGVLDEISVIPPGRVFVYLTICKVVINQDDAAVWLGLLWRVLAGLVFFVLLMSLCIALTMLSESTLSQLVAILLDLFAVAAVILLEHSQSTVLANMIAIEVSNRTSGQIDKTSIAVTAFVLLQILSYALALAIVIVLDRLSLGMALMLFLLFRELLVSALWRLMLYGANEDGARLLSDYWYQTINAEAQVRKVP